MNSKKARTSSKSAPETPGFFSRALAWTLKPIAFTTGLVARIWASRSVSGRADAKAAQRLSRREEKRRRKELWRATTAGRRRAA